MDRMGRDVYEAVGILYANPVPYDAHPELLIIITPMVFIVVAFATSATLYEESPVISVAVLGLTIGVLSTVSFETGAGPFFAVFLVCGIALLLFTGDGARWGEGPRAAAVVAGVAVALLALALPNVPVAREAIQPAAVDWTTFGTSGASRLAVQADVGSYLTQGRDAELMRVGSREPLLWRGGTLDYFDGVRWSSTVEPGEDDGEEISPNVPTYTVEQTVEILEAETNLLFGAYSIDKAFVRNAQERSDGSWTSIRPFTEGSSYRVLSSVPQPTTGQLEAAGAFYPATVQTKFLPRKAFQLPANRPEILGQTAQSILADYNPQTPYQAARAIERYLIYDGGFRYNINADFGRGDDAIEEFLGGDKQGFCTQFATSMALLAREMGVPSRVVYGTTSGDEVEPNEYVVTGYDVHTWVEVYFPGVGWYPFDPTPGFSVPSTMQANAPRPELPIPEYNASPENPAPRQQEPSEPKEPLTNEGYSGSGETSAQAPYYVVPPVLLLVILAAGPLLKRLLAARGRPGDLYRDLVGRLRDVSPLGGAADSPALTPTERLLLLAGVAGVEREPFREFARTYSESLYAPDPSPSIARAYRVALREYENLPRWKRVLGALNPASLLLRARQSLAAFSARIGKALRGRKH
jgi:transglutaminase-like putative cysteine protease